MSRFSGKCDFCDTVESFGAQTILDKYDVYLMGQIIPLKFEIASDLIPYYSHTVAMMGGGTECGGTIYLSSESFVNTEEQHILNSYLEILISYWKKCKKKKKPFDRDKASKKGFWLDPIPDFVDKLVSRVEEYGDKATIEGIHTPMSEYYRQKLYDEMVSNGWSKAEAKNWCFGFRHSSEEEDI